MAADTPAPAGRRDALEEAGRAIRDARSTDRDELLEARRALVRAEHAQHRLVRAAERELARRERAAHRGQGGGKELDEARQAVATARAQRRGVEEIQPLLSRLTDLVEDEETVLDLAPGLSAGHDGILVATDRRLLFLAPRSTFTVPYGDVRRTTVRGRWLAASLSVTSSHGKAVVGGLSPARARAFGELVHEHAERQPEA